MERFRQLYKSRVAASKEFLQVFQHKLFVVAIKYARRMSREWYDGPQIQEGQCEQDCGHRAKLHHLELLPVAVAERYEPWLDSTLG